MVTLNINGMATPPRIAMLEDFWQNQEKDIILLQEVTRPVFDDTRGFQAYTDQKLPNQGDVVGTGCKSAHQETLHP